MLNPMNSPTVIHADLSDILYEGRNKSYGGYQLRHEADRTTFTAFAITTIAALTSALGHPVQNPNNFCTYSCSSVMMIVLLITSWVGVIKEIS